MRTVATLLGRRDFKNFSAPKIDLPLPEVLMGIEVEIDQDRHSSLVVFPDNYEPEWRRTHDGSLHNGYEFVLAAPLKGQSIVDSVYKLYSEPAKVLRSYTGSTHIHINMMDGVDSEALRTLTLLAYTFENLLYEVGDSTRKWCGYANRLISAPSEVLESIIADPTLSNFARATGNIGRYYGLNLNALTKYGTVEFRYFPTAESPEELISWVKLVQQFKKAAIELGSIDNLITTLSNEGTYTDFINTYFFDHIEAVLSSCSYPRVHALMNKALIVANTTTPKRRSQRYRKGYADKKFEKLIKKMTKKKGAKLQATKGFKVTHRGIPGPVASLEQALDEGYVGAILLHSPGNVYISLVRDGRDNDTADWALINDTFYAGNAENAVEILGANLDSIREYIDANRSELEAARVTRAMQQLDTFAQEYDRRQAVEETPYYDDEEEEF